MIGTPRGTSRSWSRQSKHMQRRGAQALFARKKEQDMNQIDRQDPCEPLRTAGFTEAETEYLGRLRRAYREQSSWLTPAEERRLAFVRWLVATGSLEGQVALARTENDRSPGEGGTNKGTGKER